MGWNKLISIVNSEVLQRFRTQLSQLKVIKQSFRFASVTKFTPKQIKTSFKVSQRREAPMAVLVTIAGSTTKHSCWDQQQCSTSYGCTRGEKKDFESKGKALSLLSFTCLFNETSYLVEAIKPCVLKLTGYYQYLFLMSPLFLKSHSRKFGKRQQNM